MIEIKLSVEEYNRLYKKKNDDDCYYDLVFCIQENNKIQLKTSKNSDKNIDYVLAEIDLNTSEGKIVSKCTGCTFTIYENDNSDSEYFIRALFLNRECYWCDNDSDCCKKNSINELLKNIVFVDPISYRTFDNLYFLKQLKNRIEEAMKEDTFKCNDSRIAKINETMADLRDQLQKLINEWDFERVK